MIQVRLRGIEEFTPASVRTSARTPIAKRLLPGNFFLIILVECKFANFRRRTTLTRHQNHHTGSIRDAEIATAAALAARPNIRPVGRPPRSPTNGLDSGTSSLNSTPSPSLRSVSLSPATSDLPYGRPNFMSYPPNITSHPHPTALHTRDLQPLTPGPTPTTTPTAPSMVQGISRPPTSNPSYTHMSLPPLGLQPSPMPRHDDQRSGSPYPGGSHPGSPHLSAMGSPQMSRGSPHLSSMGYHSPSYPANPNDEAFFYPPPPPTSFQAHSASPEPGLHYGNDGPDRQRDEMLRSFPTMQREHSKDSSTT